MRRGYVRLWRCSEDSAVWQDDVLWRLWCHLVMRARYEDGWVPIHGVVQPVRVLRGQLIVGRMSLHASLYPTKRKNAPSAITLWRRLDVLRNLGNLNIETNSRFSLVTICNYDVYNSSKPGNDQPIEHPVISQRSANDQPVITKKKVKESKEESAQPTDFKGPLLEKFETAAVRERLGAWFPYVAGHPEFPKRLLDIDQAAASLCQQCGTPVVLTDAISQAIGAGWASIRPNSVGGNGKPATPETKTRMFT